MDTDSKQGVEQKEWDIKQIQEIIPHRYPFLLIDKIIHSDPGKGAVGIKNVTMNEPYFQGHFPNYPVMPGVLIVEALAQVGVFAILSQEEYRGQTGFFTGIDRFRFRNQVKPGDILRLEVELLRMKRRMGKGYGKALVNEQIVAEGEIKFAIFDPE